MTRKKNDENKTLKEETIDNWQFQSSSLIVFIFPFEIWLASVQNEEIV